MAMTSAVPPETAHATESGRYGDVEWHVEHDFVQGYGFAGLVWWYEVYAPDVAGIVGRGYRTDRSVAVRRAKRLARDEAIRRGTWEAE